MSFVYIAKLIPQARSERWLESNVAYQTKNTKTCTIIDVHLNDRCYKRIPSIYPPARFPIPTPHEGRIVIHVPLPQFFKTEVPEKVPFYLLCLIPEWEDFREIKFLRIIYLSCLFNRCQETATAVMFRNKSTLIFTVVQGCVIDT